MGPKRCQKTMALLGAASVHLALAFALSAGLSVRTSQHQQDVLKTFTILPEAPPAPEFTQAPPRERSAPRREGQASPQNVRSRATEIIAPPVPIILQIPPPIVSAPVSADGYERSSGTSDRPGPGAGSGGQGVGTGSGRYGDGSGGGGGIGPRQIKGRIRNSDYPQRAVEAGVSGLVSVRYTVATDGRVSRCIVTQSSGNNDLDETTCRLIRQRFVFRPAIDAEDRPVVADIIEDHEWIMDRDVPPGGGR